uniref:C2H2-type domain-containing protein n=1 Tax=Timema shepardi TaxID=629360 RepID=A0A7R9AWS1_TIMSH|nr:unnamed protein product [Timema shepardi]
MTRRSDPNPADGEDEPHDISSFILEMGTDKEVICWLCDRVFASKHCLDKHLIKHHRVEPLCLKHHFVCPKSTCSVSTVSYAALGKHMKETHPMFESPGVFIATEESSANTFDCPLCCQGLKRRFTIGELVTHLSNYVWGNLQCPVCRKKIVGIVDLVVHLQNNLCEVDEDGMTEMDTSVVTELNVANSDDKLLGGTHNSYYKCGYCELGFDSSNLLLEHASIIHGVKYMLDSAANTYSLNLFLEQIKSAENKPKESVDGFAVHVDSFRPAVALKQGDESFVTCHVTAPAPHPRAYIRWGTAHIPPATLQHRTSILRPLSALVPHDAATVLYLQPWSLSTLLISAHIRFFAVKRDMVGPDFEQLDIEHFIGEVRNYPDIWNVAAEEYHGRTK